MTRNYNNDRDHMAVFEKIPHSLRGLAWEEFDPGQVEFYDGDSFLAAVPVCVNGDRNWGYEFSVVTVSCDEDYFALEVEGEPWGWELDCIDWYVRIK